MITIDSYDTTLPSMQKTWKEEFRHFLIKYYEPSLVNAENVFKAINNVDSFIKKHSSIGTNLLQIKDVDTIKQLRSSMLTHRPFAMGPTISANDFKVIVLDRYIEFLSKKEVPASLPEAPNLQPEEEIQKATEGFVSEVKFFRSKRNRAIRNQCAERDHYTCQVCGFNFEKFYGERGKGFIEIHHTKPISSYDVEHEVKLEELVALCSNCHSMVHYGGKLLDISKLKENIRADMRYIFQKDTNET